MKQIPNTKNAAVLRTDFSDQTTWEHICTFIQKPAGFFHFRANVNFVDDMQYANISKDQLLNFIPADYSHSFIIVVDRTAISMQDHPLLIVDLYEGSGQEFRCIPSQVQSVENNLSSGNMDFEEFAEAVDNDGIFRGFSKNI